MTEQAEKDALVALVEAMLAGAAEVQVEITPMHYAAAVATILESAAQSVLPEQYDAMHEAFDTVRAQLRQGPQTN